jgi:hypothetical protein
VGKVIHAYRSKSRRTSRGWGPAVRGESLDVRRVARDRAAASTADLLCAAIADRRLVAFTYKGYPRIAEPHDYGVIKGVPRLLFYQVGGESESGRPLDWRWAELPKILGLQILESRFPGPRPTRSGQHTEWEVLIATVSPRPVSRPPARRPPSRRKKPRP